MPATQSCHTVTDAHLAASRRYSWKVGCRQLAVANCSLTVWLPRAAISLSLHQVWQTLCPTISAVCGAQAVMHQPVTSQNVGCSLRHQLHQMQPPTISAEAV